MVVARYRDTVKRRYLRADAAFASLEVYSFLEAEGYGRAVRLPANAVLQRRIAHLLKRLVGPESRRVLQRRGASDGRNAKSYGSEMGWVRMCALHRKRTAKLHAYQLADTTPSFSWRA